MESRNKKQNSFVVQKNTRPIIDNLSFNRHKFSHTTTQPRRGIMRDAPGDRSICSDVVTDHQLGELEVLT